MTIKTALSMLCVTALGFALAGCAPIPPSPPQVCVDFEPPLALGTQYGTPAGQAPGTVIFATNSTPVSIYDFRFTSGGGTFGLAKIDNAPVAFGQGQSIRSSNINLEFDFTRLGFPTSQVQFEFLDMGGFENISVNGNPNPIFAGELSSAPNPIGGISYYLSTNPVTGGHQGTMTFKGTIRNLRIGGQEFWIDNVCVWK